MKVWLDVLLYSTIGSVCMVAKDVVGTILVDAIANGKARLAGNMDAISDVANIVLASFSGVELIHLGWRGCIGILPIALTGKFVTQHSVKWSDKNIHDDGEA
jgi:hypothetical protein